MALKKSDLIFIGWGGEGGKKGKGDDRRREKEINLRRERYMLHIAQYGFGSSLAPSRSFFF